MKNTNSKSIIFAFLTLTLLILSSIGSFGISTETVDKEDITQITDSNQKSVVTCVKTTSTHVTTSTLALKSDTIGTLGISDFNQPENILVAGEDGNESYPSMVVSGYNALVAYEYEDESDPFIYLRNSNNYGQSWSEPNKLVTGISVNSPSLCVHPGGKNAYGVFFSSIYNSGIHGIFEIPDISGDIHYIEGPFWNWSVLGFSNFSNPDIVYHKRSKVPWITGFTGSTTYVSGPANNSLMLSYLDEDSPDYPDVSYISWDTELENCSNVSLAMNDTSDELFGVCEIQNESNQDLLFFNGFYDYYYEGEEIIRFINLSYGKLGLGGPENLTHPQIFVKGNQIFLAVVRDSQEIVLFNSSDWGDNWYWNIVTENQPPIADFSYSAERLNVSFFDESTDIDGQITSWFWEFGDGTNSTDVNPQHEYTSGGEKKVNLTVKDNENEETTISKIITLNGETPIADFIYNPINPSADEVVTFNSTSTAYPDYFIENFTWDFGDESGLAYGDNVTHQYTDNGSYIVNLTVRDNISTSDSIEKIVKVGLVADFSFSPVSPFVFDMVNFNDLSSISGGSLITNWTWDFGDGNFDDSQNTAHQYMSPGIYMVNLTIKDEHNTTDSILKQIIVKPDLSYYIPKNPMLFANKTYVFLSFTIASNLFILNSSDLGESWSDFKQINDQAYSVVEEYRFADMPDEKHIVWTDNRDGNYDIYYYALRGIPETNLLIVPGSVNLTTEGIGFILTKNRVKFTIRNDGNEPVEKIRAIMIIEYNESLNKTPMQTDYVSYILYLSGNGAEKTSDRPLFRLAITEFIRALIDFAGIEYVTVTVIPGEHYEDPNLADNTVRRSTTYEEIFPRLAFLENIFLIFS